VYLSDLTSSFLLRTGCYDREYSFAEGFFFLFFSFSFLVWLKKYVFWGRFFFPDSSRKSKATLYPSFLDIFTSFGVKNICALFCEID